MTKQEIIERRDALMAQFQAAQQKRDQAEAALDAAQKEIDVVDGAIQENQYWLAASERTALNSSFDATNDAEANKNALAGASGE
jgi:hypothetical protein